MQDVVEWIQLEVVQENIVEIVLNKQGMHFLCEHLEDLSQELDNPGPYNSEGSLAPPEGGIVSQSGLVLLFHLQFTHHVFLNHLLNQIKYF